jgi:hypothetical protein
MIRVVRSVQLGLLCSTLIRVPRAQVHAASSAVVSEDVRKRVEDAFLAGLIGDALALGGAWV